MVSCQHPFCVKRGSRLKLTLANTPKRESSCCTPRTSFSEVISKATRPDDSCTRT